MSSRPRRFAHALALLTISSPAAAIPPYPPSQKGSRVSTYSCSSEKLVLTESWDYAVSRERDWAIVINGKPTSSADTQKIANEIAAFGAIQSNFAVCTRRGPELILLRYTPTEGQLRLSFSGGALVQVGVANASTGPKLNYRTPKK
jgi:hypothetical protein